MVSCDAKLAARMAIIFRALMLPHVSRTIKTKPVILVNVQLDLWEKIANSMRMIYVQQVGSLSAFYALND